MKYLMPEERKDLPIDLFGNLDNRSFPIVDLDHAIMAVLLFHEIPVRWRSRVANLINQTFARADYYVDKKTTAITFRPYATPVPPGKERLVRNLRGYDEMFDSQYYIEGMRNIILVNGMVSRREDQRIIAGFLAGVAGYVCDSWYMRLASPEKPTLLDDLEILDLLAVKDLFNPSAPNGFVRWGSPDASMRSGDKIQHIRDKRRVHEVLRAGLDLIEDQIKDVNAQIKMREIFNTYARLLGFPNIQMSKKELDAFIGDTTLGVLMDLAPYDNGEIRPSMYSIEYRTTYGDETAQQSLQHVYGDILYLTRRAVKACVKSKRFENARYYTDDQYPIAEQTEMCIMTDVFSRVTSVRTSQIYLVKRDGAPTIPVVFHDGCLYSIIGKMTSMIGEGVYMAKYLLTRLCGDESDVDPIIYYGRNVVQLLKNEMAQMDSILRRKIKIRVIVAKMNNVYDQAQSDLAFQNIIMNARTGDVYLHHMGNASSFMVRVNTINKEFKAVSQGKDIAAAKELACELLTMRCEQYLCDPQVNPAWSEEISKMIGRRDIPSIERNHIETLLRTIVNFIRMHDHRFNLYNYYMDAGYNKAFYSIQQVPPIMIRQLANVIAPTDPKYTAV